MSVVVLTIERQTMETWHVGHRRKEAIKTEDSRLRNYEFSSHGLCHRQRLSSVLNQSIVTGNFYYFFFAIIVSSYFRPQPTYANRTFNEQTPCCNNVKKK